MRLDARVWILWVIAIAIMAMMARNPFYSLMILIVIRLVARAHSPTPKSGTGMPLARISLAVLIISALYNALFLHLGETVLLRLPVGWPLIGGPITLEAAVHGLNAGLILVTLLYAFDAFGALVPVSDLVRVIPRAFHDVGIVVLIAVTYIPETRNQMNRIREAQAVRGHRIKGLRDWRPILVPLLVGGLERAMGLAEAMVSRGFGATVSARQPFAVQVALLLALLASLVGWILVFWNERLGWSLLGVGIVLLSMILLRLGRGVSQTRYQPSVWSRWDTLITAMAIMPVLLITLPIPFVDLGTLSYVPFPSLDWPGVEPWITLAIFALVSPASVLLFGRS